MITSVIFDLDGTLADSFQAHYLALRDTLKQEFDLEITTQEFKPLFGKLASVIITDYLHSKGVTEEVNCEALAELKHTLFREKYVGEVRVLPGAKELLEELRDCGVNVAVASNSPAANLSAILSVTGLIEYFNVSVAADEVIKPKPDPEMLLKASEKIGVDPIDCVAVDDSIHGIQAAHAAKMKAVAVLTGGASPEDLEHIKADMILKNLSEVDAETIQRL